MEHETPNPSLKRLEVLVGEWSMEASVGGQPMGRNTTTFEWLEGGAFLVQHADTGPPLPSTPAEWVANSSLPLTTVTGLDDSSETFCMLYADSRGVFRVYQMSLSDGVWKLWRDAPGFFQRSRLRPDVHEGRVVAAGAAAGTAAPAALSVCR